jgi:hypothetical protein
MKPNKTENFNLSEKIKVIYGVDMDKGVSNKNLEIVRLTDIKEFIRRLKEEIQFESQGYRVKLLGAKVIEIIDKLAGCFETGDGK